MKQTLNKLRFFYKKLVLFIVCAWAVLEIALCTVYYYAGSEDHVDNFLYKLCEKPQNNEPMCGGFMKQALLGRIITAALLLLGSLTVC